MDILTFSGRRKRLSYFLISLALAGASFVLAFLAGAVVGAVSPTPEAASAAGSVVGLLISLPFIWPSVAIGAQRLHDMGYSGWFQLLFVVPLLNLVLWLVMVFAPSQATDNRYGPAAAQNYVAPSTQLG